MTTGAEQLARQLAGLAAREALLYHLFINFPTITPASVLADFTEASWTGYAPYAVAVGAWSAPIVDSAGNAVALANPPATYTNTSAGVQPANGFFVTGQTSGFLYAAEEMTPGFLLEPGSSFTVYPALLVNTL